ncbi:MAG TPA: ATP-dependent helicase, partial [Pseudomonadota bacterium]|nr:ATP-dependent helicase [Pseudomonadota bacterium]
MHAPQNSPEPPSLPGPPATDPAASDQAPRRELGNGPSPEPAASAPSGPPAPGRARSEQEPSPHPLKELAEPGLAGLTAAQREVVEHGGGPLLVVAGPGAGKTRTLTARLCHLLATAQVQPAEIVAVTFTRKAAAELQERLGAALGSRARELTVGTFHRVALLLRPLPTGTTLLSEGDRILFCEQALEDATTRSARQPAKLAPRLARVLSLLKGQRSDWLQGLEQPAPGPPELAGQFTNRLVDQLVGAHRADFQAAARRYAELLAQHQAEDLDDLLLHALAALRAGSAARRFGYVAVDEYQDVSGVQRELVRALGEQAGVLAIGDPDQAIYAFRGAEVGHFHAFAQDFSGARLVHLRENFRSLSNLVTAAAAVIAHQPERTAPLPIATRPAGALLVRFTAPSLLGEALFIVREVDSLVGGTSLLSHDARRAAAWAGASYGFSDIAVLTRTAARADELAAALQQEGVPIQRPRRAHLDSAAARELL